MPGDAPFEMNGAAVGHFQGKRSTPGSFLLQLPDDFGRVGPTFGEREIEDRSIDDRLASRVQNFAHRRIEVNKDKLFVEDGNAIESVLKDRAVLHVALPALALGLAGAQKRVDSRDQYRRLDRMRPAAVGAPIGRGQV